MIDRFSDFPQSWWLFWVLIFFLRKRGFESVKSSTASTASLLMRAQQQKSQFTFWCEMNVMDCFLMSSSSAATAFNRGYIVSVMEFPFLQGPLRFTFLPYEHGFANTLNMNEVKSLDSDKTMFDYQHSKSLLLAANNKKNRCKYVLVVVVYRIYWFPTNFLEEVKYL